MKTRQYVSKSSMENFSSCEMRYFYEYILKNRGEAGLKTVIGSAVHSVMEVLARLKKGQQDGLESVETELGKYSTSGLLDHVRTLSNQEVDDINKSRTNKQTYKDQKKLKYGLVRENEPLVEELIDKAFSKYLAPFEEAGKMKPADIRDYKNFVWMTLEEVDPRKENVFDVEYEFDIPLPFEWAELENGEYLRIKGFIDLITQPEEGVLYIYDYKTGQRLDFVTGDAKTYKKIKDDLQLRMYNYVLNKMFPDQFVVCNLFFIRDGGVFTVNFDETNDEILEMSIKDHLDEVRACTQPKLLDPYRKSWKCKYLCPAYKNYQFDSESCDCRFLSSAISELGLEKVEELYKKENFNV